MRKSNLLGIFVHVTLCFAQVAGAEDYAIKGNTLVDFNNNIRFNQLQRSLN